MAIKFVIESGQWAKFVDTTMEVKRNGKVVKHAVTFHTKKRVVFGVEDLAAGYMPNSYIQYMKLNNWEPDKRYYFVFNLPPNEKHFTTMIVPERGVLVIK